MQLKVRELFENLILNSVPLVSHGKFRTRMN